MSATRVAVLTPPGTGAIATVAVAGPQAWELVRAKFRPAKGKLPESPPLHRFWFGHLGDGSGDEVVLAVRQVEPEVQVEIHCHGGRRVVRWLVDSFSGAGCAETIRLPDRRSEAVDLRALDPLTRASTTRTASVLLDQYHGAFDRAVRSILEKLPSSHTELARLAALAPIGRHLVAPWRVVIAGPPNVGKSSLINALAGYQRSVVAPIAGTTRDVVTVQIAADGWPIELSDTAGLRDEAELLEAAGIELAKRQLATADVVVWVIDLSDPNPYPPPLPPQLVVGNKCDLAPTRGDSLPVSATTGTGVSQLLATIVARLVPVAPYRGEAVPFIPELTELIEQAHAAVISGNIDTARRLLESCLSQS